jgi:WD repeat-containing protein 45
MEKERE